MTTVTKKRKVLTVVANQIPTKEARDFARRILPNHVVHFVLNDFGDRTEQEELEEDYPRADFFIVILARGVRKSYFYGGWTSGMVYNVFLHSKHRDSVSKERDINMCTGDYCRWVECKHILLFDTKVDAKVHLVRGKSYKESEPIRKGLTLLALCMGSIRPTRVEDFASIPSTLLKGHESFFDTKDMLNEFPYVFTNK